MTTPPPPPAPHASALIELSLAKHVGANPCKRCGLRTHGVDLTGKPNCADCGSSGRGVSVTPGYLKKYKEGKV